MFWEVVFMLVILKIPVVYMCAVVWWAIRADPSPLEGAALLVPLDRPPLETPPGCGWRGRTFGPQPGRQPRHGRLVGARRAASRRTAIKAVSRGL